MNTCVECGVNPVTKPGGECADCRRGDVETEPGARTRCEWNEWEGSSTPCPRPALMAVRTTRAGPKGDGYLRTTVFWSARHAPRTAARYCPEHGTQMITDLARAFTWTDETGEDISAELWSTPLRRLVS